MSTRTLAWAAVAAGTLGFTGASLASPSAGQPRPAGQVKIFLKPCCSTLPVRPGSPPPDYGPRLVRLQDHHGTTLTRKVPMSHWTVLRAPVGRYDITGQGCSSAHGVRISRHSTPAVTLTCPVP